MSVALRCRQADQDIIADRSERFQRHVPATPDSPFLGLFHPDGADEAAYGCLVGEDPDDIGAPLDLAVQTRDGVVLCSFVRCCRGKVM